MIERHGLELLRQTLLVQEMRAVVVTHHSSLEHAIVRDLEIGEERRHLRGQIALSKRLGPVHDQHAALRRDHLDRREPPFVRRAGDAPPSQPLDEVLKVEAMTLLHLHDHLAIEAAFEDVARHATADFSTTHEIKSIFEVLAHANTPIATGGWNVPYTYNTTIPLALRATNSSGVGFHIEAIVV